MKHILQQNEQINYQNEFSNKINIKMQTINQTKYSFFKNQNEKKRSKTIESSNYQDKQSLILKQSTPIMIQKKRYLKDSQSMSSSKGLDFRTKIIPSNINKQSNNEDIYKKYTEEFAIPKFSMQANAQSINELIIFKNKEKDRQDQNSYQNKKFNPIKKIALSNNKSYDPSKRTAIFTRKSLYSINSLEKDKRTHMNQNYPDRFKSLDNIEEIKKSKQIYKSRQLAPYLVNIKQRQKQGIQSKKKSFSISRNRYLIDKNQSNKNKNNKRYHSNSHTAIIDNNFDKLIKKQFSSVSVKQLNNEPVVRNHLDPMYLTDFQKQQIKTYKDVYYIGHKAYLRKYKEYSNFRDQKNNYKPIIGDHIAYRFQIVRILGSGAFGKVLQVIDHKSAPGHKKKSYALKILKKSQDLYEQFKLEIKILKIVKQNSEAVKNIVQIKGDFQFRNHICLITQLLDLNVYSYIKNQQFQGLSLEITRKIMIQVLQALLFLHYKNIVHCDIKPQNIVFKQEGKSGVKLIDFGSACFKDKKQFTYIQSRYYRSPQIVLVKPYDEKIDVWSAGCLAYQIFTGSPLFPARCQEQQMEMLKQTLGKPPLHFLDKCQRAQQFVFQSQSPVFPLQKRIDPVKSSYAFLDFLQKTIRWSPQQRLSIKQALMHDFILQGLPQKVKKQHISQMKSSNPYGLYQS